MYAPRRNGGSLHRFIAEQILGITLTTAPAAFLVMTSMIALAIFSFACSSPTPTEPIHERETPKLTPTLTSTPTLTPTPTPELLPPVTLDEPEDGSCFGCGSEVVLRWDCPRELQAGEFSRLRVRWKEQDSFTYHEEYYHTLIDPPPGEYNWAVAMVRATAQDEYVLLNEESAWRSFEIVSPPVVHSISPTCTAQGTSVTVVVSGENFTRSLALAIGIPFPATFVNSSTITTTIPTTLEAGKYPVIVKDSLGQGDSFASFTVSESTPVLSEPALPPWSPATPVPTAPPGYNPIEECVVPVCAPAPMLIEPLGGTQFAYGGGPELKWSWTYCLPDGWKFAVRVSLVVPPSSISYVDSPNLVSCHNGKTIARFPLGDLIKEPGIYYWNIAVVRSVGFGWERLSYESEVRSFEVLEPRDDEGSP
jgi:hypothetical protein